MYISILDQHLTHLENFRRFNIQLRPAVSLDLGLQQTRHFAHKARVFPFAHSRPHVTHVCPAEFRIIFPKLLDSFSTAGKQLVDEIGHLKNWSSSYSVAHLIMIRNFFYDTSCLTSGERWATNRSITLETWREWTYLVNGTNDNIHIRVRPEKMFVPPGHCMRIWCTVIQTVSVSAGGCQMLTIASLQLAPSRTTALISNNNWNDRTDWNHMKLVIYNDNNSGETFSIEINPAGLHWSQNWSPCQLILAKSRGKSTNRKTIWQPWLKHALWLYRWSATYST